MAEIARMTRDEDEGTTPPTFIPNRDRPDLPRAGQTLAPDPKASSPPSNVLGHDAPLAGSGGQRFVPHVRPALLSEPRASPVAAPPRAVVGAVPGKSTKGRAIAISAFATLALASAAGLYFSGFTTPPPPSAGKTSLSAPEPPQPTPQATMPVPEASIPEAEASKPLATDNVADSPEPPQEVPAPKPQTEATLAPAENQADAAAARTPPPAASPKMLPQMQETQPSASGAQPPAENATPSIQPDTPSPPAKLAPALPPVEKAAPPPVAQPDTAAGQKPAQQASQQAEAKPAAPAPEPAAGQADATRAKEQQADLPPPKHQASRPAKAIPAAPIPEAAARQEDETSAAGRQADLPPASQPEQATVALNVPKPEVAPVIDDIAQRVSWVRDFSGGDCFYASVTSITDKTAAIEGFGTAVQPFEQMLADFQAKFHVEPDINVRLIEPSQCEVTNFLRFLGQTAGEKPQLVLDRTSVPNGTPISGTLVTRGGLISSVLLIDHKGMMFNLDDRMVVQSDKATFSIPIGLGAADRAAGKAVPQIIMVITGPQDIQAAAFSTPMPASQLLPKIVEEIEANGSKFSASAKYFRLGG
ncbi:hypothetical protein RQ479_12955 [Mesorhizobium sp. ISC25]|uniref:hypothetical protein n=1 Tax=Mesorhizobium sp. ISC25 TaxID=3077335 RepID=UPI0035D8EE0A